MDFTGKVAIITGASRGLGRHYAREFAKRGASVAVNDVRDCSETVQAIEAEGAAGMMTETDVTSADSARAMADAVLERFGRIDVLVNNAGLYGSLNFRPFEKLDEAEWDKVMNVNVKGIWQCCKAVLPAMKQQGSGSIVNISSLAATYGMPNGLHYTASKAAVIGLTRGLAREVGRYNIRVNAVAPNVVNTDATAEVFGDKRDKVIEVTLSQQAIRRPLETADIVGAVLFLASDLNHMTTGQTLMVDGGTVML
ncbi:MAG: 3-oxoacyl-ACP reductase FabG [Gammaproteobacteria bacterium]|nr:3-oxoacyl-ACP reductase FabG [Gammaproteobacteria bacterium]MDH4254706.1 3-oxoacyl-ACP reductase FabG [Gammaproteobacteria bacterium]MDH5308809.1 3-oxoacyl-ACP reductase FabG [Gammaproteobacteria bacterium]